MAEMIDREKVIKDLEFCVNGHFKVELSLATKILELLKEQEARLLTEEEIQKLDEGQFVWIQIKDDMLYCLEIIGMCGVPRKYTDIQFNAPASFPELNIERYKKIWVAWTTQPTEEQQDEVKWDA